MFGTRVDGTRAWRPFFSSLLLPDSVGALRLPRRPCTVSLTNAPAAVCLERHALYLALPGRTQVR